MARVEIRHKCIMIARDAARKDSDARMTGVSLFVKRYYGKYRLLAVRVSKKQRSCRDMFAEAQKLAKEDLREWNRKRHWGRLARRHKVGGAHRMAVSAYYKFLKENEGELAEALLQKIKRKRNMDSEEKRGKEVEVLSINRKKRMKERARESRELEFLYKRLGDIGTYYKRAMRLAS